MDFARSADPAVQRQLDRLAALSPGRDILGLERISALLARLGHPERRLPPVFHVAGTNGKGSTCAVLRAAAEAAGLVAHVYTSPHLVRFNERIRLAGTLIDDPLLAALLAEALDAAGDIGPSFFEVTTAAAFLAFARTPADLAIIEVGMGGRLDATNAIPGAAICGIAALGLDHQAFLGTTLGAIAGEKAGIARAGTGIVTLAYPDEAEASIDAMVAARGARRIRRGRDWDVTISGDRLAYRDAAGTLDLPLSALAGPHQAENAGLAVAMLRHQRAVAVPDDALARGLEAVRWPARLQRLGHGPVARVETWLDGGHNPSAASAIAAHFAGHPPLDVVIGMLANKDAETFLGLIRPVARRVIAVPVEGHDHHAPADLAAMARAMGLDGATAPDLPAATAGLAGPVLITGSLYLAGVALDLNGEPPR
ncbi:bifunctional folylpolyglutamate synthase/dihydrofolate synthase [Sphingomonas changnyeongensis]|uniref:tetrahydrofolate synthase n=1 Tax=Sphingomonas changnyeongensis TaxID=2698679 RepID=A0A7Z2NY99_9SPHN|nr:bifunctional folylpolyglutamate synthase/dihydrofolate synthase [Sphingomonas changnyeongensis]QHL91489.1 bifunctional folylpolyglutamate synthase/dihydrofolate synthase [Sphingomonas changnyeongensis]